MFVVAVGPGFVKLFGIQDNIFTSSVHSVCYHIIFLYQNSSLTGFLNFMSNYAI